MLSFSLLFTAISLFTSLDEVAPLPPSAWSFGERLEWEGAEAPAAREHAAFVLDTARDRAVMIAGSGYEPYGQPLGDAWAFDLEAQAWSALPLTGDPLTPGGARRTAVVGSAVYLHGGYTDGMLEIGDLWSVELADEELRVRAVAQENPPPARLLHGFGADARGETFVVFGGVGGDEGLADTWIGRRTEDGVRWTQLELDEGPGERFGFSFAVDPRGERFLVCGGQVPPTEEDQGMIVARDLWSLDFTAEAPAWRQLATYEEEVFPGRRNPAFVLDPNSGDLLVWGGTGDGRTPLSDLYVVATRAAGAPVTRVAQPEGVPARASSFGVVDIERRRAWLGFGNSAKGLYVDLVPVRSGAAE